MYPTELVQLLNEITAKLEKILDLLENSAGREETYN